ncbi:unnamed protein product [Acanthoscelides obtectus]|nr:unnamed protein product [Acanthoscelides obtectus]CAK1666977.1 hypothetical protein AOBTE_LOCUS25591 [Acanthoscelides obtectus]
MMCGLIMYIAIFKSEVGSKLRPRSQLRPAAFEYYYGYSFIVYVSGVVFTQLSGVSCIFLYLYRAQYDWKRKQLEDHKRGDRPGVNHYSHHIDSTELYPCRRHPSSYVNSNSASHYHRNASSSAADQKRFYLSKEQLPTSPCSLHQTRSQSNSVKDVSTFYDFPPPPTISYQFPDQRNYRLPRDVTSNTMSTTADVAIEEFLSEQFESDYSPSIQRECEFVTFDLDQPLPLRAPSVVSINSNRNGRTDTLRRTTPV